MKTAKKYNIYEKLQEAKGADNQVAVCIEELAELTKELTKVLRKKGNTMHIIEEIGDVEICLEQLKIVYDPENKGIDMFKDFKLRRLELFYLQGENYK